ncbi:MAG: hypothetical protein KGH71_04430 [Candidatus Micrarchaeota archaeon]|nr:hypothetical protein [Candidatus Micrarchaeota archaeon]
MNYYAYIRRRVADLSGLRFKMQKLFAFVNYSDFDRMQALMNEMEQILKKYENM